MRFVRESSQPSAFLEVAPSVTVCRPIFSRARMIQSTRACPWQRCCRRMLDRQRWGTAARRQKATELRISAAAYSVAVAVYFYSTAARRRELARSGVAGALSGTVLLGAAIAILSILGLLLLAAGLVGPGLYLFALFSGLFSAGMSFFTVFMSLVPGRE